MSGRQSPVHVPLLVDGLPVQASQVGLAAAAILDLMFSGHAVSFLPSLP